MARNLFMYAVLSYTALASAKRCEAGVMDQSCTDRSDQAVLIQKKTDVVPAQALQQQHSETELDMKIAEAQKQSLALAKAFAQAASAAPASSAATKKLFESFLICGQCKNYKRFGEAHDGGYLMCMDGLNSDSVKAAYSLGVEHHDQWSEDVLAQLNVGVNQFDCTVQGSNCQGCTFFKKCIVSNDGKHPFAGHESESWTLEKALSETGQGNAKDGSLLMKMDIESSEWPIYASEKPEVLAKFGELIVEFHNLRDESKHETYLKAMQHILGSGLKVAHLHGNNFAGTYTKDASSIPDVLEVTFVHSDARPEGCLADQKYNKLDNVNNPNNPELPMAHID